MKAEISRLANSKVGEFTVGKDTYYRSSQSHIGAASSYTSTVVSITSDATSHSKQINSSTFTIISLIRTSQSHTSQVTSTAARDQANYAPVSVSSHTQKVGSFTFNERTSLELLDYTVTWNDDAAMWYTPWVQETRILGDEDSFAVRGNSVDDAKDPCAIVEIEYDASGNGTPDEVSNPIHITSKDQVHEVEEIPLDENSWYRIGIYEYSGYNSLYSIDMGIIH